MQIFGTIFSVTQILLFVGVVILFTILYLQKYVETNKLKKRVNKISEELSALYVRLSAMESDALIASNAKTVFLGNISHEIRTPMNSIMGFSELALDSDVAPKTKEYLQNIRDNSMWLMHIINDILDISKMESGVLPLTPVVYDTASLINDVITLNITAIREKPITFCLDISDDLPCSLKGDAIRVKQIMNNLLDNAIKFTQKGSITLRIACVNEGDGNVRMKIVVSDTGSGIKPEEKNKLFSNFDKADMQANSQTGGIGLGLSITKNLVELMSGEIFVESEYGFGSTFSVEIIQGFVNNKQLGAELAKNLKNFCYDANKLDNAAKLIRNNLSYAQVLVVDDMPTNLDVAVGLMQKYKMKVDAVTSGAAAIERIRNGKPVYDAIFMDHMMPEMDGIEAVRIIRNEIDSEYAKKVPIIALTANVLLGNEALFFNNGFQAFLSKPIDILKLDAILNRWVRDKSREASPTGAPLSIDNNETQRQNKGIFTSLDIDGLDVIAGLSLFEDEEESYMAVLRSFASHCPSFINIVRAYNPGNLDEYRIAIHGIKGSCRNIGAIELGNRAEELEKAAKNGDSAYIEAKNGIFSQDIEKMVADINKFLEGSIRREG